MLSGYPVGSKLLSETDSLSGGRFYNTRTAAILSTCGPVFILGSIGGAMLKNYKAGLIILLSHYISVFFFAVVSGFFIKNDFKKSPQTKPQSGQTLSDVVYNSVISILIVGGFICLFYILIDMLGGLFISHIGSSLYRGLISGLIEISRGCYELSNAGLNIPNLIAACAFLVTFGGICITLQCFSFFGKSNMSKPFYVLFKTIQGFTAAGAAYLLSFLLL